MGEGEPLTPDQTTAGLTRAVTIRTSRGPVVVCGVQRAFPGEEVSGDLWRVDWHQRVCRISLIDGLGHGPEAAAAAAIADRVLAEAPALDPPAAIARCHQVLRDTRGAAMLVLSLDLAAARLTVAGVGNVDARWWGPDGEQRVLCQRGIVGRTLPSLRAFAAPLPAAGRIVLHTDGVSDRFRTADLEQLWESPQWLASRVLTRWGRANDDATVVVVALAFEAVPAAR
jgi:serine phosphatase RsbU (regulator of sigma subunit)